MKQSVWVEVVESGLIAATERCIGMPVETWRLLDLGAIDPLDTQVIYDMVAQAITENDADNTLIICWPAAPLVSLGYFQEIEKDIDLGFCRSNRILVTRRVIGGGGVYLDDGQLFYQLIGRTDSQVTPKSIDAYYRKFLEAPLRVYRSLGMEAEFKPVNDIQVGGRKISGNGAGDVGDARILTGNLIFDFNFDMMVRVLRVPDEKFRDKIAKSLRDRMTTILKETGSLPDRELVKQNLIGSYEDTLDINLESGKLSNWEKNRMKDLRKKYRSREWLYWREGDKFSATRNIKISATASMGSSVYKAPGGLIRCTVDVVNGRINEVFLSGDFFMVPSDAIRMIEKAITGVSLAGDDLLGRLKSLYSEEEIQSPGVTPEDLEKVVKMALEGK